MTVLITKNISQKEVKKLLSKTRSRKKGIDMAKFSGKLKWKGNALKTQQSMRDE